jgi:hypothetical protein
VYLEQICNRVAIGTPDMTKRDYLVDAATQIRLALERDVSEDYEAAFNHYQNGVDVLLRGMHGESGVGRDRIQWVAKGQCGNGPVIYPSRLLSVHTWECSRALCWPCRTSMET